MIITVRRFHPESDYGFVYGTWSVSAKFGTNDAKKRNLSFAHWKLTMKPHIERVLKEADVYVACAHDDSHFLIGSVVILHGVLQWIYVKNDYRQKGIARMLIKGRRIDDCDRSGLTLVAAKILEAHPDFLKEKTNEPVPIESPTQVTD